MNHIATAGSMACPTVMVVEREHAGLLIMDEGQSQDRNQHQETPGLGKDEKLDGGIDPALMSPDADQEVHGHQHHFPEDEKENRSIATKTPRTPARTHRRLKWKNPTCFVISVQEATTAMSQETE